LQHRVLPEYPAQARSLRLEGPVVLEAMVMEDGSVHDIKLVSGHPTLARAALDAVRQWRYQPYRLNGKPVAMRTEIRVTFKLPKYPDDRRSARPIPYAQLRISSGRPKSDGTGAGQRPRSQKVAG